MSVVRELLLEVVLALGAAAIVSWLAWRFGALSRGGALAATLVGGLVFGCAGLEPAVVLVFFFLTSSGLSHLPGAQRRPRRDARQVLANGSVAALAALFHHALPAADIALLGAVAAATADTWATEVGLRLGGAPRSILTWRPRAKGASGAVSASGSLAGAAGAAAVGLAAWLVPAGTGAWLAIAAGGLVGATTDSVLGDALQARYECRACGARPETARHEGCQARARHVAGLRGLDNDLVNGFATAVGALAAMAVQAVSS